MSVEDPLSLLDGVDLTAFGLHRLANSVGEEIHMIPVGSSAKLKYSGTDGGTFHWKPHDLTLTLPSGCADETVIIEMTASVPDKSDLFVSAVFDIGCNVKKFRKPVTVSFPHCVRIKSFGNKSRMHFFTHNLGMVTFLKGKFEVGSSLGSIEVTELSTLGIIFANRLEDLLLKATQGTEKNNFSVFVALQAMTNFSVCKPLMYKSTLHFGEPIEDYLKCHPIRPYPKRYYDVLLLPTCRHQEIKWIGYYCIVPFGKSYLTNVKKYFGDGHRIKEPFDVYIREVSFLATGNPDEACARLSVVDKDLPVDDYVRIIRHDAKIAMVDIDRMPCPREDCPMFDYVSLCLNVLRQPNNKLDLLVVEGIQVVDVPSTQFDLLYPAPPFLQDEQDVKIKNYCKKLLDNYAALVDALPIGYLLKHLLTARVIAPYHKSTIQAKNTQMEKVEYLLDDVIYISLKNDFEETYERFLAVLKEHCADDLLVSKIVKRLS